MLSGADPGQTSTVKPSGVPIPLYEMTLPDDQGTQFMAVAPADSAYSANRAFRSGVISAINGLFRISPVVAVTGSYSDDITSFFMPLFLQKLKSRLMPYTRVDYNENVAQELALHMVGAGATTFVMDWDPNMENNANIPGVLKYGLMTNPQIRILLVNQQTATTTAEWARRLEPFMTHFHGDTRWYAAPVVGILPQMMSPIQAARYLFGGDEPKFLDAAAFVANHIPLVSSFLPFLKSAIGSDDPVQTLVEIMADIPQAIGIRNSNDVAAVQVEGDRVIANFSAAELERIKTNTVTGLIEPGEGYETRVVTPNPQSHRPRPQIDDARRSQQRILLRYRYPNVLRGSVLTNPAIINNYFARNPAAFQIRAIP